MEGGAVQPVLPETLGGDLAPALRVEHPLGGQHRCGLGGARAVAAQALPAVGAKIRSSRFSSPGSGGMAGRSRHLLHVLDHDVDRTGRRDNLVVAGSDRDLVEGDRRLVVRQSALPRAARYSPSGCRERSPPGRRQPRVLAEESRSQRPSIWCSSRVATSLPLLGRVQARTFQSKVPRTDGWVGRHRLGPLTRRQPAGRRHPPAA